MKQFDKFTLSDAIRDRLLNNKVAFGGSDNISQYIHKEEIEPLRHEISNNIKRLLKSLLIDIDSEYNIEVVAFSIMEMYFNNMLRGRFIEPPMPKFKPSFSGKEQLSIDGPIQIEFISSNTFKPILGSCVVGIFANTQVLGMDYIVQHLAARVQTQDEMTVNIANYLEKITNVSAIAVIVRTPDFNDNGYITTSSFRGILKSDSSIRAEFCDILGALDF